MKKIFYSMSALVMAVGLNSCDSIAEADRLIYVAPAEVSKNVLIEDFTGQLCINCPEAAETIHELQEAYGNDKVIAVGLYSGPFGKNSKGLLPLTTETGNYYYEQQNVESQPSLNIDRKGLTSDMGRLQTRVTEGLQEKTPVTISPTVEYDAEEKKATLKLDVFSSETIDGAKLQVWLMEDSIVSPQKMPSGTTNKTYVHNHVFRATVTDRDGKTISLNANAKVSEQFEVAIDDNWIAKNLNLVVFVFNADGVKQTEIIPVLQLAE